MAGLHGFDRLGQGADLVELDQQGVGSLLLDAAADALGVGDQQVVADDLDAVAHLGGHQLPAFPVVLGQAVFDGDDRVLVDPRLPEGDHLLAGELLAFLAQVVLLGLFVVQFGGGRVEGDADLLAGLVAGLLDGFQDHFDGLVVGLEGRGVTALVAHQGGVAAGFEHGLEGVVDLGAPAQAFGEGWARPRA